MTTPTVHCSRCNASLGSRWLFEKAPGFQHARNGQVLCGACLVKPEADDYDPATARLLHYETLGCTTCHGRGEIVTCIDDMCHGQEECIHGDGYSTCPDCGGTGDA